MNNFPYAVIVLTFTGLTFAGFMGWLKPKPAPLSPTTEEILLSMDEAIDRLQKSHSNRAQRAAEYNDRIHQFAYVVAIAGYCAATNGVPFEHISNSVHRIVVDHFEIK